MYVPLIKVKVADGSDIMFTTLIGGHPPDVTIQPNGMVSPVKKPGSPPPDGFIVGVCAFDEHFSEVHGRAVCRVGFDANSSGFAGDAFQVGAGIGRGGDVAEDSDIVIAVHVHDGDRRVRHLRHVRVDKHAQDEFDALWHVNVETVSAGRTGDDELMILIVDRRSRGAPPVYVGERAGEIRIRKEINPLHCPSPWSRRVRRRE